jgi:hypothetical protein
MCRWLAYSGSPVLMEDLALTFGLEHDPPTAAARAVGLVPFSPLAPQAAA